MSLTTENCHTCGKKTYWGSAMGCEFCHETFCSGCAVVRTGYFACKSCEEKMLKTDKMYIVTHGCFNESAACGLFFDLESAKEEVQSAIYKYHFGDLDWFAINVATVGKIMIRELQLSRSDYHSGKLVGIIEKANSYYVFNNGSLDKKRTKCLDEAMSFFVEEDNG